MRSTFRSTLDIKSMISILREKISNIDWKMGDSEFDGFYVRGRTNNGIKIKITKEDRPERYFLGICFYDTSHASGPLRKLVISVVLRFKVIKALAAKRYFSEVQIETNIADS